MRVVLFTETFPPQLNGIVKVACLTLDHYQRSGIQAMVVTSQGAVSEYNGVPVVTIPTLRNPLYRAGKIGIPTLRTLAKIQAFQPDLIHVLHPVVSGFIGRYLSKYLRRANGSRVPTIASFHIDLEKALQFYSRRIASYFKWAMINELNACDYALAPSQLLKDQLIRNGVQKVGLWRRGVNAEQFNPRYRSDLMRARLTEGHPDRHILLYVGRLAPEKQVHQLKMLLERIPGTHLAIVGDGICMTDLMQQFAGLAVTFVGTLSGVELSTAYASSDCFVFASAFESFGLVLLEAMASGLPVVSSRVGGANSIIIEGDCGFTFPVNDTEAMVQSVQSVLSSASRRADMAQMARHQAEIHSWEATMDELFSIYISVIQGQPPQ